MLTRWDVTPSPTPKDPDRRLLLLKASAKDIQGLIRKLGGVCGRPKKDSGNPDYNFRLFLHGVKEETLAEIEEMLKGLIPGAPAPKVVAPAAEAPDLDIPAPSAEPAPVVRPADGPKIPDADEGKATEPFSLELPSADPGQAPASANLGTDTTPLNLNPSQLSGEVAASAPEPAAPATEPPPEGGETGQASAPFELKPAPEPPAPFGEGPDQPLPSLPESSEKGSGAGGTAGEGGVFGGMGVPGAGAGAPPTPQPVEPDADECGSTLDLAALGGGVSAGPSGPASEPAPAGGVPAQAPLAAQAPSELWGSVRDLDPLQNLDTLLVSAGNRFVHAAATQILSNPGAMYNPLFIHGGPAVGKTHMLNAVGHAFKGGPGDGDIWLSSGPALARAAAMATAGNRVAELEAKAAGSKVLLVDDIQLMGVAEQNQGALKMLFKTFLQAPKQLVLTSSYSHRMLGALESALDFKIAAGQAVELKPPPDNKQGDIVRQVLEQNSIEGAERFTGLIAKDFSGMEGWVRRLISAKQLLAGLGQPSGVAELQALVFSPDAGDAMPASEEEVTKALSSAPALPPEGAVNAVLSFPTLQDSHADWIWSNVLGSAGTKKWPVPFRMAVRKAYAMEQVFAAPFIVAEECYQSQAKSALLLGPPPGSDLAEHEADFRYVCEHLLRDAGIALGWIPYSRALDPKYAVLAYLDMTQLSSTRRVEGAGAP